MSRRLVEAIREGGVPEIVRRKASAGELPISLEEKIEILVILASDANQEIRDTALSTVESWPQEELAPVLANPSTPEAVMEFAAIDLAPGNKKLEEALLHNPNLPLPLRDWLLNAAAIFAQAEASEPHDAPIPLFAAREDEDSKDEAGKQRRTTLLQRIHSMSPVQKIKTALIGSQEERLLLVRDPNRLVSHSVLESAKLSEHEVEKFASMKDVDEEVLRVIASNRKFMKNYRVVRALINNPRTPIDVGIPLIKRTSDQDLKWLVLNRNVSQIIRVAAQKRLRQKEEARKRKFPGQK